MLAKQKRPLRLPVHTAPTLFAVNISNGGIPRKPVEEAFIDFDGLAGDHRAHEKHRRLDRAVSLLDYEMLLEFADEGYSVWPGRMGENLTVVGLNVQQLSLGTHLKIDNVILRLEQPRKPCYVLDAVDPRLKDAAVGRCGYMASVLQTGAVRPGAEIQIHNPE